MEQLADTRDNQSIHGVGSSISGRRTAESKVNQMEETSVKLIRLLSLLLLVTGAWAVPAQAQAPAAGTSPTESAYAALLGQWSRTDGDYTITINKAEANGKLDAAYANPNPLPFSKAEASRKGKTIKLFFELRAGGYNGSTYSLEFDPAEDVLRGVYHQAVANENYDIEFQRVAKAAH